MPFAELRILNVLLLTQTQRYLYIWLHICEFLCTYATV